MMLPLFQRWWGKAGPGPVSPLPACRHNFPSLALPSTEWKIKGHVFSKDTWDTLPNTLHCHYLHEESLVCGKEDKAPCNLLEFMWMPQARPWSSLALHLILVGFSQ